MKQLLIALTAIILTGSTPQAAGKPDPAPLLSDQTPVTLITADSKRIAGSYFAPEPFMEISSSATARYPGIILLHMWKRDRHEWDSLIPRLRQEHFAVIAIDFRGHGESFGHRSMLDSTDFIRRMAYDGHAAWDWLRVQPQIDPAKISIIGASIGSSIAIQLCATITDERTNIPPAAIALLSPAVNYFALYVDEELARCRRTDVLFCLDRQDPSSSSDSNFRSGKKLYDICTSSKTLIINNGLGHGTNMLADNVFAASLVSWIKEHSR